MLELDNVHTHYGLSHVLQGVSLSVSFLAHSLTLTFTVSRLTFIVQHSGQVAVLSL